MKGLDWHLIFKSLLLISIISMVMNSCQSKKNLVQKLKESRYIHQRVAPSFNEDSAYSFIEKQISFGPRVPETPGHQHCGDWLVEKLSTYGANVIEQRANIIHYTGQEIEIRNIIGSYQPNLESRILLFAHWDTRPFADNEASRQKQQAPILGADDGASGVSVLLEIARHLKLNPTNVGIDIIFFDMEDWGQPSSDNIYIPGEWWCVGSRYWSEQPHKENYKAMYGILLDMVGGANATFMKEGYSQKYASSIISKIWDTAHELGYNKFFVQQPGGYIIDDHVSIIENLKIPCVDIINLKNSNTGFASHWHTHSDDINIINKETLQAVGQTVMEVIYREK